MCPFVCLRSFISAPVQNLRDVFSQQYVHERVWDHPTTPSRTAHVFEFWSQFVTSFWLEPQKSQCTLPSLLFPCCLVFLFERQGKPPKIQSRCNLKIYLTNRKTHIVKYCDSWKLDERIVGLQNLQTFSAARRYPNFREPRFTSREGVRNPVGWPFGKAESWLGLGPT